MFYIYILFSESSNIFYVGHTDDPVTRYHSHNHSKSPTFTSKHRPWKMVALFEAGKSRAEAMKTEDFIKKQKSRKLIEKLVDPEFVPHGKLAQLVRVPYVRD